MANAKGIFQYIPEVRKPEEKRISFNVKFKWTLIVLILFFVLSGIPLYGLTVNALENFKFFSTVLGADFGSLISLGVGPIVMASIILQLLVGSQIVAIDTTTAEGKRFFQGVQKLLVFFFIIFESMVFVLMGGFQAAPGMTWLLVTQLIIGGFAIFYLDEVVAKWGFGSGVSLFIGAGISKQILIQAFQFVGTNPTTGAETICLFSLKDTPCPGKVFVILQSLINPNSTEMFVALAAIIATIIVFLAVVWAQSLKVEIPLSYGRIKGYQIKWPLAFFYASVIPVILVAALVANLQLFGGILQNKAMPCLDGDELTACNGGSKFASHLTFLGHFSNGVADRGFLSWVKDPNPSLVELLIRGGFSFKLLLQGLTHILFFTSLAIIFSIFWVKTSGMDAKAQAHNIGSSGLQISGFRQDERVLESILERYVMPLTVMGGAAIGLLASATNLLGALVGGTAVLLVIMIMYQFYQNIAQQHSVDMHPVMRKFMKV
ncbi:preprotein translocase subunit SecY [Candidatus Pacearchaeota archaeon CG10_big_fil_rev_8_21_14_0_10_32_14]|nr:MAG: preprotein translocase subunit SecY [Candidatus Pacearchaeota archaeon CG10_big_fil_rev_8_21_14_0_10_32_14]